MPKAVGDFSQCVSQLTNGCSRHVSLDPCAGERRHYAYKGELQMQEDPLSRVLDSVRSGLLRSYRPKKADGVGCACCGKHGVLLSFHAIDYYQEEGRSLPRGFVSMSQSRGVIRGCFPICTKCAPTCRKCGLPKDSETLLEFFQALSRSGLPGQVVGGNGRCEHMHASLFFHALVKRVFRRGRFANN